MMQHHQQQSNQLHDDEWKVNLQKTNDFRKKIYKYGV